MAADATGVNFFIGYAGRDVSQMQFDASAF